MKFKIQQFAALDELKDTLGKDIENTKNEINSLNVEKQNLLNDYNTNYNNQLTNYDNLMNEQQNYINTWAETEKQNQQKQTDYNVGLINQNKAEAEKQTNAELGDAYIDYQKGMNQYGGNAEVLASQGLAGTGFAKNTDIAMNITYQNRVGTAKAALTKANTEYDNQIQQALLNNDAALAEVALQQMQQSYQLALQGFEYKNTLYNNKLSYEQSINDDYFNRANTLQNRIDSYNNALVDINQYQEQMAEEKLQREREYQQWQKEFAEEQRQFNAQMAENQRQYNMSYSSDFGFGDYGSSNYEVNTEYYKGNLNKDAKNGTFSNGYQPNNINGKKLTATGNQIVVNTQTLNGQTKKVVQNIWKTPDGKQWYWDGRYNKYIQYSGKSTSSSKNSIGTSGGR